MKRLIPVFAAAIAIGFCAGCSSFSMPHIPFFGHKRSSTEPQPPKEDSHIATASETDFKQRWVDKRSAELVAQGLAPDTARAQATAEFNTKFSATHVAH